MSDLLKIATHQLLDASSLSENQLSSTMSRLMRKGIDYADLYFQSNYVESWVLENGIIKSGSFDIDRGLGVRALSGEKTGFAYADDIVLPALLDAADAANSIVTSTTSLKVPLYRKKSHQALYPSINPLNTLSHQDKVALLQKVDQYVRHHESAIKEVMVSLAGCYETILIMNSEGCLTADVRPLVRFNVNVILEKYGRRESGVAGGGGRFDYQTLLTDHAPFHYADEALRQARINLEAIPAPAGLMTVVLGPGWVKCLM